MFNTHLLCLCSYDASPFGHKVHNILLLKGIQHQRVDVGRCSNSICAKLNQVKVSRTPPRPALSELLGINYRRIPVLAIGRDVYCDTSLIASVLERRFPLSEGYETLFPDRKGGGGRDTGMIKSFAMAYTDRTIFPTAARMMPWEKLPPSLVADRSSVSTSSFTQAASP